MPSLLGKEDYEKAKKQKTRHRRQDGNPGLPSRRSEPDSDSRQTERLQVDRLTGDLQVLLRQAGRQAPMRQKEEPVRFVQRVQEILLLHAREEVLQLRGRRGEELEPALLAKVEKQAARRRHKGDRRDRLRRGPPGPVASPHLRLQPAPPRDVLGKDDKAPRLPRRPVGQAPRAQEVRHVQAFVQEVPQRAAPEGHPGAGREDVRMLKK